MTTDDMELVRQYAAHQSESAFAALVSRHTNLVYSVSLRRVRDPQLAEEVTQAVFIILARKAGSLGEKTILPSWLYRAACYTSNSALKREYRRQRREQEAYMQSTLNEAGTEAAWKQMSPLLEEAMLQLNQTDRDALVLRFFKGHSLNEVSAALGANEDAAKKRVNRAVEKLQKFFLKRGVSSTAAIIAGAISANSVQAAPVALAKSVTAVAIAKGAAASSSTLALVKGTMKMMTLLKAKTGIVIGAIVVFATGISMRELALHETLYLCFGGLLSLVLPMMMSAYAPSDKTVRKSCMKIVWIGQVLLVIAILVIKFSEGVALYAIVIGSVSYLGCAVVLRRKLRAAQRPVDCKNGTTKTESEASS